jgi:hypothetical protein
VLALLLQRFRLRLADNHPVVRPNPSVTLRPAPGVYLRLSKN